MGRILVAFALLSPVFAADQPPDLMEAARKGRTAEVEAWLAKGADIETKDRDGRTPLMLAAQYGRTPTVKLLLAKGANTGARDSRGWNAYMLALLAPSGGVAGVVRGAHDAVLHLLPAPRRFRLQVNANWPPDHAIFSSCFMRPPEMLEHIRGLRPDAMAAEAFERYTMSNGRGLLAVVRVDARGSSEQSNLSPAQDADAVLELTADPDTSCVQGVDQVTMPIRVQLFLAGSNAPAMDRKFGEGLKIGMKSQSAMNANQHEPLFQAWAKSEAGPIYWAVIEALLSREW